MFKNALKYKKLFLSPERNSEVMERVVLQNGKLFRVRFVILERGGKLRGKVLSCEAIEVLACDTGTTAKATCLPSVTFTDEAPLSHELFGEVVSPYFSLDFLTSIQIRAPSL